VPNDTRISWWAEGVAAHGGELDVGHAAGVAEVDRMLAITMNSDASN